MKPAASEECLTALPDLEAMRGGYYALLSRAMAEPPDEGFLSELSRLTGDDATPLGRALSSVAAAARASTPGQVADEFTRLFYGMGQGGEVLPYASYYLTGNLHDRPLAQLRGDMARLGLALSAERREPEDHVALVLEMMHALVRRADGASLDEQEAFFAAHLAPWASELFSDLATADAAEFYRAIAALARAFLAVEGEAFALTE